MRCDSCRWFFGRSCHRYPTQVAKTPQDIACGEYRQQVAFNVKVEEKQVYTCTCGREFRSEQGLKTHVGRLGGKHAFV